MARYNKAHISTITVRVVIMRYALENAFSFIKSLFFLLQHNIMTQIICNIINAPIIKYLRNLLDVFREPLHDTSLLIVFEAVIQNSLSTTKPVP